MLRGLVFAAAMVVVRLFQGALINAWQTQAGLISIVLLLLFVIGVVVWGVLDGRADARANRGSGSPPGSGDDLAAGRPVRGRPQRRRLLAHLAVLQRASTPGA